MRKTEYYWIAFILGFLAFSSWASFGAEISYVSTAEKVELKQRFESAKPVNLRDVEGKWTCDMIGVRSGMQRLHSVPLYVFSRQDGVNHGDQIVSVYSRQSGELTGDSPQSKDTIRKASDGTLISRLNRAGSNDVLAYSLCRQG